MPPSAAALLLAAAFPGEPCTNHLCGAEALAPFAARLERLGEGEGEIVHILQLGDSHTAGDTITGPLRRRLQARWGDGGRGVLAPGRPYPGYLTWDVTAAQSGGWSIRATFGRDWSPHGAALGLAGYSLTARAPGEWLAVTADGPEHSFDRLIACALVDPNAGSLLMRIGSERHIWPLMTMLAAPECRTLDSPAPATTASVTVVGEGIVSVTSVGLFRRGGIALSNLGVSGSQLAHFGRGGEDVVRAELAAYAPDLVILAFGTNEGFSPSLSADAYEAALREEVARIRRHLGEGVPILLLGAPDAATRERRQGAIACGEGWFVPIGLDLVSERQQRVASELGLAFWDWTGAMGGTCASLDWHRQGLMRADRVHFTRAGGERLAARLEAALVAAVERER